MDIYVIVLGMLYLITNGCWLIFCIWMNRDWNELYTKMNNNWFEHCSKLVDGWHELYTKMNNDWFKSCSELVDRINYETEEEEVSDNVSEQLTGSNGENEHDR